jgi:hypothetical protein
MIILGLVAITAAMLLVRLGWSGRRGVAPLGWALGVGGLLLLAANDGAWGVAVGAVAGMAVAIALVLHAGWRSPVKVRRPARTVPSITLPHRPADIARHLFVFVLVVPIGFAAAQWLTFGAQALARRAGAGEADALALTLILQPVLWGVLMAWQMTRATAMRMIAPPASAAILGTILWSLS